MISVFYWLLVVIFYLVAITSLVYVFLVAISFFRKAPYVPLNRKLVKEIIRYFDIKSGDEFIDIGSGDGYIVNTIANLSNGVGRYTGVEIDRILVFLSNVIRIFSKYKNKVSFICADAVSLNYSKYNKVFMYMTTEVTSEIFLKIANNLKKETIVISAIFPFSQEIQKRYNVEEIDINISKRKFKIYRLKI